MRRKRRQKQSPTGAPSAPPLDPAALAARRRDRRIMTAVVAGVALLLFVPQVFSSRWRPPSDQLGLARVYSGDEPHYLVILNSLVLDGDLDLTNNYADVHRGGDQAGDNFRGQHLDHHTSWTYDGKFVRWPYVYEMEPSRWRRDKEGHPVPTLRPGRTASAVPAHEYSYHWPGLPLLLAPVLFPLGGSTYLEPAAIFCSWLVTVLGMLAFVSMARRFGAGTPAVAVATVLAFLGTPAWTYSRTFFTEPYTLCCGLCAYALFLRGRGTLLPGVLCGIGMLMKNTFVLMALPLGLYLVSQRRWKDTLWFGAPLAASLLTTLLLNHDMYGSYLRSPQPWESGLPLHNAANLMVSSEHGLLPYAPIALSALIGWPALFRANRQQAALIAGGFGVIFAVTVAYMHWHGGYCFGPRYLVPVIPFLMLGLVRRLPVSLRRPWLWADIALLGALSIWINFRGAVPYWAFYSSHPLGWLFK